MHPQNRKRLFSSVGDVYKRQFEFRYYKGHLNKNNVLLTQGVDAVCIFVNDKAAAEVIHAMAANGVKLLALR